MSNLNVEIKAKCSNLEGVRDLIMAQNGQYDGRKHQVDTYFNCINGRLKLREVDGQGHLIRYERDNTKGPKRSEYSVYHSTVCDTLKCVLAGSLGVLTVVDKKRDIYTIDNVEFHLDTVDELGTFIEIEATDSCGNYSSEYLLAQCQHYLDLLNISAENLIPSSYSDLLLAKKQIV